MKSNYLHIHYTKVDVTNVRAHASVSENVSDDGD